MERNKKGCLKDYPWKSMKSVEVAKISKKLLNTENKVIFFCKRIYFYLCVSVSKIHVYAGAQGEKRRHQILWSWRNNYSTWMLRKSSKFSNS